MNLRPFEWYLNKSLRYIISFIMESKTCQSISKPVSELISLGSRKTNMNVWIILHFMIFENLAFFENFVSGRFYDGEILCRGDFVPGRFCPWEILYLVDFIPRKFCTGREDFVPGRLWVFLIWRDFVLGRFCPGEILVRFCPREIMFGVVFPERFCVRGDFVPGRLWVVIKGRPFY